MDRREFVSTMAAATGVGCAGLLAACAGLPYVAAMPHKQGASVSRELLVGKEFVLVRLDDQPAPVFLAPDDAGGYVAVVLKCTHRGCEVQPAGEELECPCHGSRFDLTGARLDGPAPRDLDRLRVLIRPDHLIIVTSQA